MTKNKNAGAELRNGKFIDVMFLEEELLLPIRPHAHEIITRIKITYSFDEPVPSTRHTTGRLKVQRT